VLEKVVSLRERLDGGIELTAFGAQLPEVAKRDYGDHTRRAALEHLIEQLVGFRPLGDVQQPTDHLTAQEVAERRSTSSSRDA
jgi:hypothetical protein